MNNATFIEPTAWSEKKDYKIYDCVLYNDNTYMAVRDVAKGVVPTDVNYWKPFQN